MPVNGGFDMAQDNCQKIKLLKLIELLRQETDEQNPLTTSELCRRLEQMHISCDRRTLSKDIALLNEEGFEVMSTQVGKEKGYYVEDRSFSVPELKILIDAVQAAGFITKAKTEQLTDKLASLGGSHRAEILKSNMVWFNTRKHSNESIYYNVDFIEDAIARRKKISFRYYDLNENGEKIYRHDGAEYISDPVALVYNEDNYYLIAYSKFHENAVNYRVDRMAQVKVLDASCDRCVDRIKSEVAGYTEQAFKMYGGRAEDIVLEFCDELIGVIYDRFGEDTKMMRSGEHRCIATVRVQISPVFWGWLFQFAGRMRILAPEAVIVEFKEFGERLGRTWVENDRKTAEAQ